MPSLDACPFCHEHYDVFKGHQCPTGPKGDVAAVTKEEE